jgi:D-alanyl-D-alanine carboxypeptidase/D-alanyl-D-alanine-endopeptidase (penicillin-binding protein 4)
MKPLLGRLLCLALLCALLPIARSKAQTHKPAHGHHPPAHVSHAASVSAAPRTLAQRIEAIMARPEFRHALFGMEFYSLDHDKVIYAVNADKLFTPGSTTKLLTEGTALELFGADYRFHTRVYRTSAIKSDGTLDGDLVFVAGGDPNLSGRLRPDGTLAFEDEDHSYDGDPHTRAVPGDPLAVIRDLARQVAARGIRAVRGRVIVDNSLFPEGERELGTGVVMSPVMINDNLVDLTVGPGAQAGDAGVFIQSPQTAYVRFVNQVQTGAAGTQAQVRFADDVEQADGSHTVTVAGTFPLGMQPILYSYAVPRPSRFAEVVFIEALRDAGVRAELSAPNAKHDFKALAANYQPAQLVAEHTSPPYREEVKVTLKVSQNLHASVTPMLLAALLAPNDKTRDGFDLEREYLQRAGLDLTGAQQADGAGGNAHFTPAFICSFLAHMSRQANFQDFYNALPILGRDGTLFDIQPATPAAGHVHAKTGTFGVGDPLNGRLLVTGKGLAGYMTTARGERLAFAAYVNNVSVPPDQAAIKRITGQMLGEIAALVYEAAK